MGDYHTGEWRWKWKLKNGKITKVTKLVTYVMRYDNIPHQTTLRPVIHDGFFYKTKQEAIDTGLYWQNKLKSKPNQLKLF